MASGVGYGLTQAPHGTGSRPGFIDYCCPAVDCDRKRLSDWAVYRDTDTTRYLDPEKIYQEAMTLRDSDNKRFRLKSNLIATAKAIKKDRGKDHTTKDISGKIQSDPSEVSECLSVLCDLGYLQAEFRGAKIMSRASANQYTELIWNRLFQHVEIAANTITEGSELPEFRSSISPYYSRDPSAEEVRTQLSIFDTDRANNH